MSQTTDLIQWVTLTPNKDKPFYLKSGVTIPKEAIHYAIVINTTNVVIFLHYPINGCMRANLEGHDVATTATIVRYLHSISIPFKKELVTVKDVLAEVLHAQAKGYSLASALTQFDRVVGRDALQTSTGPLITEPREDAGTASASLAPPTAPSDTKEWDESMGHDASSSSS